MENNVTPEQAKETYLKTIREVDRQDWPTWVIVIHNSIVCKSWIGRNSYPDFVRKAYYLLCDVKDAKLTGIELIERERIEQQTKHGHTVERDVKENSFAQLVDGAICVLMTKRSTIDVPMNWNVDVWKRMIDKSEKERLIIAGALLAAEIDRLQALEN